MADMVMEVAEVDSMVVAMETGVVVITVTGIAMAIGIVVVDIIGVVIIVDSMAIPIIIRPHIITVTLTTTPILTIATPTTIVIPE